MVNDEKARRLTHYNKATLELTSAIHELLYGAGTLSRSLYDLQRHATEKARTEYETARLALHNVLEEDGYEAAIVCKPWPPNTN